MLQCYSFCFNDAVLLFWSSLGTNNTWFWQKDIWFCLHKHVWECADTSSNTSFHAQMLNHSRLTVTCPPDVTVGLQTDTGVEISIVFCVKCFCRLQNRNKARSEFTKIKSDKKIIKNIWIYILMLSLRQSDSVTTTSRSSPMTSLFVSCFLSEIKFS